MNRFVGKYFRRLSRIIARNYSKQQQEQTNNGIKYFVRGTILAAVTYHIYRDYWTKRRHFRHLTYFETVKGIVVVHLTLPKTRKMVKRMWKRGNEEGGKLKKKIEV